MGRISKAQLEAALGGAQVLVQLLDKDFDGIADEVLVEQVIEKAELESASAVQVAFDLDDPVVKESRAIAQQTLVLAVFWAYQKGTAGQGVPADVREDYQEALRWFDRLAQGTRALGEAKQARTSFPVEQVPIDPDSKRTTRRNMKGFC